MAYMPMHSHEALDLLKALRRTCMALNQNTVNSAQ